MNKDMLTCYLKEHILEMKQTPACVGGLLKKLATKNKTKPLSFQKVGPKSGQLWVTWFKCFIMSSRTRKSQSQHVLIHLE
jgi:hypothetical protein